MSVPESKVQEARIRLASQGLPQSDSMGIEMIQKESALGTSSMMESARYQSVLETELARTIVKVQGVQSARVHLALPKPSVFLRDARKATASVMLQLYPGRRLEPGQVAAIVHLVASSVPELAASDVTLVDQAGSLLNSPDENAEAAASAPGNSNTPASSRRAISAASSSCWSPSSAPAACARPSRRTSTSRVTEETRENYDPQKTAVRSEQTSNENAQERRRRGRHSRRAQQSAAGHLRRAGDPRRRATPGNPAAGAGQRRAAASSGPTSSSQRSTRNFEVDRTLSYVKQPVRHA